MIAELLEMHQFSLNDVTKNTNSKIEHYDFLYFNIIIMTDNLLT